MKDIAPSEIKRILNSQPTFSKERFLDSENKLHYTVHLLTEAFIKTQIKQSQCNLTEVGNILGSIGFDLTTQQKHEGFLYSLSEHKFNTKAKLFNIINEERKKVSIDLLAQWLINNIDKLRLKNITKEKKRAVSEVRMKLPPIKPRTKLEEKLEPLIKIFD